MTIKHIIIVLGIALALIVTLLCVVPVGTAATTPARLPWSWIGHITGTAATPTPQPAVVPEPSPLLKYVLYDNFSSNRSDLWGISAYKPRSSFIDTRFLTSNVWLADGKLVIRSDVNNHTGGELKSKGLFTYGKYRASMRLEQTPGTYLTFFNYIWAGGNGGEKHNEVDIELIRNATNTTALLTTWYNGKRNEYEYALPFDPAEAYHVYGYDWYKDHVSFYVDGRCVWTSRSKIPCQPTYLYLNSWVVKDVPADHGNGINMQYVDWVTVQKN